MDSGCGLVSQDELLSVFIYVSNLLSVNRNNFIFILFLYLAANEFNLLLFLLYVIQSVLVLVLIASNHLLTYY